jgi:3-dehydroquinate dehydratase II
VHRILILNGPNLNLLGTREPAQYGIATLEDISNRLAEVADRQGVGLVSFQSNAEHELIGRIHAAPEDGINFIIINPAAFTHTSVGLRDALLAVGIPFIEVHLSNVHAREEFRRHSYFSDVAVGVISGLGPIVYELALRAAVRYQQERGSAA